MLIPYAVCQICMMKLGNPYSTYFWNRLLKAVVLQKTDLHLSINSLFRLVLDYENKTQSVYI